MRISNVQNTNFGAIRIFPKTKMGKFTTKDMDTFAKIARENKTTVEAGMITGDKLTLNIMTKNGSEEEKIALASTRNYVSENLHLLDMMPIRDDIARRNVAQLGK